MKNILENILSILMLNGVILIIPGVNFFLVARHSLLNGFSTGFRCAAGITTAIMFHVILSAFSILVLVKKYPSFFEFIRYSGAAYLIYLGTRFLIAAYKEKNFNDSEQIPVSSQRLEAFQAGFVVDFLNPFIGLFYLSLFSTFVGINNFIFELSCYSLAIFSITLGWFTLVALFFSQPHVQNYFQGKKRYIQAATGCAMYYFSSKILFSY